MPNQSTAQADVTATIRSAMKEQGVTQDDLAQALGILQTSVSARLRGEVDWRVREIEAAARLLGVTLTLGGAA